MVLISLSRLSVKVSWKQTKRLVEKTASTNGKESHVRVRSPVYTVKCAPFSHRAALNSSNVGCFSAKWMMNSAAINTIKQN